MPSIRRIAAVVAASIVSLGLAGAGIAAADPGDKVLAENNHGAEIRTDQCPAGFANDTPTNGAPGTPNDYFVTMGVSETENSRNCLARARLAYLDANGNYGTTRWHYASARQPKNAFGVTQVHRCRTMLEVRRRDGSAFTHYSYPSSSCRAQYEYGQQ